MEALEFETDCKNLVDYFLIDEVPWQIAFYMHIVKAALLEDKQLVCS